MLSSPARCASPASATQQAHAFPCHGGNLARFSTWAGHFSFLQPPHDLGADGSNLNEAGVVASPLARGGAGAAFVRLAARPAKSRPLQSFDLVHRLLPCGVRKNTTEAACMGGKAVRV